MSENILDRNVENDKNVKYDKLNNPDIKQWFINIGYEASENTGKSYENTMYKISDYELSFKSGKDLYQFNYDEIIEMLKSFMSTSPTSLAVYVSIIRKYILFCIDNGYLDTNIDFTNNLTFKKVSALINKNVASQKFISRDDIYNLVEENIINPQDQSMILLNFEGIRGKDCEDMVNLKISDIDFNHSVINSNGKEILIDRRLSTILKNTINEDMYLLGNGETEEKSYRQEIPLVTKEVSPYLLRPALERDKNGQVTGQLIQRRTLMYCKEWLDRPYLTVNSIYMSGLVERAITHTNRHKHKKLMKKGEWITYLGDNNERVNIHDSYLLYKEIFESRYGTEEE